MRQKNRMFSRGLLIATMVAGVLISASSASDAPKVDPSTTIDQLKVMAESGNTDAMLELGNRLVEGRGLDKNPEEALKWFQKVADAGNGQGWYGVGFLYSDGRLGEADIAKAITYFRKGAELGNADCQASLGLLYQAGDRIPGGVKGDPIEAVKWYRLAAEQNHTEAIQHLAMMNARGMGIPQNDTEAAKWFRKGADLGEGDCKWALGQCYLDGKGVAQDTVQAYALFSASLVNVQNQAQKQAMTDRRDKLGKALSVDQLKRAEEIIGQWTAKLK